MCQWKAWKSRGKIPKKTEYIWHGQYVTWSLLICIHKGIIPMNEIFFKRIFFYGRNKIIFINWYYSQNLISKSSQRFSICIYVCDCIWDNTRYLVNTVSVWNWIVNNARTILIISMYLIVEMMEGQDLFIIGNSHCLFYGNREWAGCLLAVRAVKPTMIEWFAFYLLLLFLFVKNIYLSDGIARL